MRNNRPNGLREQDYTLMSPSALSVYEINIKIATLGETLTSLEKLPVSKSMIYKDKFKYLCIALVKKVGVCHSRKENEV